VRTVATEDALGLREQVDELADPMRLVLLGLERAMKTCCDKKDQLVCAQEFEQAKAARDCEEAIRAVIREIDSKRIA
jgi:hypothetical protein